MIYSFENFIRFPSSVLNFSKGPERDFANEEDTGNKCVDENEGVVEELAAEASCSLDRIRSTVDREGLE